MPRVKKTKGEISQPMKFRPDPTLRRAIKLRAAFEDKDMQDVIVEILRSALVSEIAEVEAHAKKPAKPR